MEILEKKGLIVGTLLLVFTSLLCFTKANVSLTFAFLCLSFAAYPISEFLAKFFNEERYSVTLSYFLIVLYFIWMIFCLMAVFNPLFLLGAGVCFTFHNFIVTFRGLTWFAFATYVIVYLLIVLIFAF